MSRFPFPYRGRSAAFASISVRPKEAWRAMIHTGRILWPEFLLRMKRDAMRYQFVIKAPAGFFEVNTPFGPRFTPSKAMALTFRTDERAQDAMADWPASTRASCHVEAIPVKGVKWVPTP
jgi:hypothetical protein